MSDYTPTTEEVRMYYRHPEGSKIAWYVSPDEFDRWLTEVKAQAWEEGFDAGERDVFEHDEKDEWGKEHTCTPNPYRQGETE